MDNCIKKINMPNNDGIGKQASIDSFALYLLFD